jgi:hypothetical protein
MTTSSVTARWLVTKEVIASPDARSGRELLSAGFALSGSRPRLALSGSCSRLALSGSRPRLALSGSRPRLALSGSDPRLALSGSCSRLALCQSDDDFLGYRSPSISSLRFPARTLRRITSRSYGPNVPI